MKTLLHVGCGAETRHHLTPGFRGDGWREIRLDIDPAVKPDLIGTITDMSAVADGSVDALYSSHNLEHIYHHEVPQALDEFFRVLKPGGFVVLTCPDLQSVCAQVAKGRLLEPLYTAPAGPISALDILYGHEKKLAMGKSYMAHKCGFTWQSLCHHFEQAGFYWQVGGARPQYFDLWLLAFNDEVPEEVRMQHAALYLPS
ncbi:MAG: class I SAM-dependent methyltransferase [Burkholderiales bacterium]|nr:class I SAM-dependent methyltransferase [Burkholderiales bacterium]